MYKKWINYFKIVVLSVFMVVFSCISLANDTSYIQENKDKLITLEENGKPPTVIPEGLIPPEDASLTALRHKLDQMIKEYLPRMSEMSDWLYYNPEPGYYEFNASKMYGAELEKYGF